MPHRYNTDFMTYADRTSRLAAEAVIKMLRGWFPLASVLDVGCAKGTWLSAWSDSGVGDIHGVDGDYVDRDTLAIPVDCFSARDLSQRFELSRTFDLVQSLEVAEHIQASAADTFVDNLVKHSNGLILFSAAPPGQGGEFHVNEQPYGYWRDKFAVYDYFASDCVRPCLTDDHRVSFWYRYNTLLYVRKDRLPMLSSNIRASLVQSDARISDVSPPWFKMRKAVVRHLPSKIRARLAHSKAKYFSR